MSKYFKLTGIPFFLFVFFLMSSCANDDTTATNTNTPTSTSTPASTDAQATTSSNNRAPAIGTLNKIWIEASKFNDSKWKNARMVFSFAIDDQGLLTLYGWACKSNALGNCKGEYDHDPNLEFQQGQSSGVEYGPVVFWENLILEKKNVSDIQDKIGVGANAYDYVLFVPENKNGHINYRIILTDKDPKNISATSALPDLDTEIDANPSPPKNTSN